MLLLLVDFSLPRDVPAALGKHSNAGFVNLNDAEILQKF
jgi:glutamyl-tRNA reductase